MTDDVDLKKSKEASIDWKDFIVSAPQAASFLGVSEASFYSMVKLGCPKESKGSYNLRAVVIWYMEEKGATTNTVREALYKAQTEQVELNNLKTRGELIPTEDVLHFATELAVTLTSGLEAMAARAGPQCLAATTLPETQQAIEHEARNTREAIERQAELFRNRLSRSGNSKAPTKRNGRRVGRPKKSVTARKPGTGAVAQH